MARALRVTLALALLLGGLPALGHAQIYRWTDEQGNAFFSEGLDSVPERYRSRATPLGLRNTPSTPAPTPAAKGTAPGEMKGATAGAVKGPAGVTTLRFTPGERILVDARINGRGAARLLLDTGADRTVVAPRVLLAAGVSIGRDSVTAQVTGVTGGASVQAVNVDSLEVGEARVTRLLVISHDINQPGLDGLLGRDFLDRFNVAIDSRQGVVTLAPK